MTIEHGREIVKKAINFKTPSRLPVRFSDANAVDFLDIRILDDRGLNLLVEKYKNQFTKDEWGCIWKTEDSVAQGSMGEVNNRVINNWNEIATYKTPDPDDPSRYKGFDEELKKREDKYVIAFHHHILFERMHFLIGFCELLEGFYTNYKKVNMLADMVLDFQVKVIRNLSKRFKGYIDGFWTTDDWGTQTSLLISKEIWRDIFKPRYKIIGDELKQAGMDWWLHSCGKINDLINDFKDMGVKVINTYQPLCLNLEEVGKEFKGEICFETTIDIQKSIYKKNEYIRQEAFDIVKNFSTKKGGLTVTEYVHVGPLASTRGKDYFDRCKLNKSIYEYFNEAYKYYYKN